MTTTYPDATGTYTITLPDGEEATEPECWVEACPKVALWRIWTSRPCEHVPADYCQEHRDFVTTRGHRQLWLCDRCRPDRSVGRVTRIERIPR